MKRGITVLALLGALAAVGYFTAAKWAIRHEEMTFYDAARNIGSGLGKPGPDFFDRVRTTS